MQHPVEHERTGRLRLVEVRADRAGCVRVGQRVTGAAACAREDLLPGRRLVDDRGGGRSSLVRARPREPEAHGADREERDDASEHQQGLVRRVRHTGLRLCRAPQRLDDVDHEEHLRGGDPEGEHRADVSQGDVRVGKHREAPRRTLQPLHHPERRVRRPEEEGQPDVPFRERVAPDRLPRQVGQERVDRPEDQQPDVQQRHVMEVADDPERVVHDDVERDRRVDDARQPGQEPRDEAEEERSRGAGPAPGGRAVDREREAVERERRRDRQRERDRLHERVDRALVGSARVVEVDVVRPDDDVRDDGDHPRDGDDVAGHELPAREPGDQQVVDGDRREEQQVDHRVAEPPEDVLREQRVDRDVRERLDDHLDEQHRERERRDHHVDRDHGQRDHRVGHRARVRGEALRPEVAEAERDARRGSRCSPRRRRAETARRSSAGSRGTRSRSRARPGAPRRRRSPSPSRPTRRRCGTEADRGRPRSRRSASASVVTSTPATPSTISHHESEAIARPKRRSGKPTSASTHQERPMTAKPAQPTKAPSPCAVMIAYHSLSPTRPQPAWLERSTSPRSPDASRITVEATRYRSVSRRAASRASVIEPPRRWSPSRGARRRRTRGRGRGTCPAA